MTIDHSSFTGGAWGFKFAGLSAITNVSITNTTIQGMSQAGAYFDGSGGHFKLRSCSLLNNVDGVDVYDSPLVDLGTAADPGNNTLTGNSATALHASLGDQNGDSLSVTAVGNTWVPNRSVEGVARRTLPRTGCEIQARGACIDGGDETCAAPSRSAANFRTSGPRGSSIQIDSRGRLLVLHSPRSRFSRSFFPSSLPRGEAWIEIN